METRSLRWKLLCPQSRDRQGSGRWSVTGRAALVPDRWASVGHVSPWQEGHWLRLLPGAVPRVGRAVTTGSPGTCVNGRRCHFFLPAGHRTTEARKGLLFRFTSLAGQRFLPARTCPSSLFCDIFRARGPTAGSTSEPCGLPGGRGLCSDDDCWARTPRKQNGSAILPSRGAQPQGATSLPPLHPLPSAERSFQGSSVSHS